MRNLLEMTVKSLLPVPYKSVDPISLLNDFLYYVYSETSKRDCIGDWMFGRLVPSQRFSFNSLYVTIIHHTMTEHYTVKTRMLL